MVGTWTAGGARLRLPAQALRESDDRIEASVPVVVPQLIALSQVAMAHSQETHARIQAVTKTYWTLIAIPFMDRRRILRQLHQPG